MGVGRAPRQFPGIDASAGSFLALVALLWGAGLANAASAQVIEVGPGGEVSRFTGPVQTFDGARRAIATQTSALHSPRPPRSSTPSVAVARAIETSADGIQLSARLMEAVAWQESRFQQGAVSPKGARGVMQLMPETAKSLGVDALDLRANVRGGGAYLARLLEAFDGDIILALAAYNAGPEAVRRFGGVPPYSETRAFVAAVLDRLAVATTTAVEPARR